LFDFPRGSERFLRAFGDAQACLWVPAEQMSREAKKEEGELRAGKEEYATPKHWSSLRKQVSKVFGRELERLPESDFEASAVLCCLLRISKADGDADLSVPVFDCRWKPEVLPDAEKLLEELRVRAAGRLAVNRLLATGGSAVAKAVARLFAVPPREGITRSLVHKLLALEAKYTLPCSEERKRALLIRRNAEVVRVLETRTHRTCEEDEILRATRNSRGRAQERRSPTHTQGASKRARNSERKEGKSARKRVETGQGGRGAVAPSRRRGASPKVVADLFDKRVCEGEEQFLLVYTHSDERVWVRTHTMMQGASAEVKQLALGMSSSFASRSGCNSSPVSASSPAGKRKHAAVRKLSRNSATVTAAWLQGALRGPWGESMADRVAARWLEAGLNGASLVMLAEGGYTCSLAERVAEADGLSAKQRRHLVCAARTVYAAVQAHANAGRADDKRDGGSGGQAGHQGEVPKSATKGLPVQDLQSGRQATMGSAERRARGMLAHDDHDMYGAMRERQGTRGRGGGDR